MLRVVTVEAATNAALALCEETQITRWNRRTPHPAVRSRWRLEALLALAGEEFLV